MKQFKAYCSTESSLQHYYCTVIKCNTCFDGCLWQELVYLWRQGVETVGCCCGNHTDSKPNSAYIQVEPNSVWKMKELGYETKINEFGNLIFIPKTEIIKESNE